MNVYQFKPRGKPDPRNARRPSWWGRGPAPALLILAGAVLAVLLQRLWPGAPISSGLVALLVVLAGAALTQQAGRRR